MLSSDVSDRYLLGEVYDADMNIWLILPFFYPNKTMIANGILNITQNLSRVSENLIS